MKQITELIIVRHGETEWNLLRKLQGHQDSPLTEKGREQAQCAAAVLKGKNIDYFYSSDLGRAKHTAEIINEELKKEIIFDTRLRERKFGIFENIEQKFLPEKYPEAFKAHKSGDVNFVVPGGESRKERYDLHIECINEIVKKHSGSTIMIVSHGGFLESIFISTLEIPLESKRKFSIYNASISRFSFDNEIGFKLLSWGMTEHLSSYDKMKGFSL